MLKRNIMMFLQIFFSNMYYAYVAQNGDKFVFSMDSITVPVCLITTGIVMNYVIEIFWKSYKILMNIIKGL